MPRGINAYDEGRLQGRNVANANSSNIISPGIVTEGLVLHLDAGNYNSYPIAGTTWYDLSGRRSNVTLINGPAYIRSGGGSISFDGVNDYSTISPVPAIAGGSVTVSLWNFGIQSKISSAFWFHGSSGRQFQAHLPYTGNTVYFDVGDQGGETYDRIQGAVANADYQGWHHWTFIKDASANAMYIYRDRSLWLSGAGKTKPINTITSASIGADINGNVQHNAYIANFLVYNRALSSSENLENFNATRARFGV